MIAVVFGTRPEIIKLAPIVRRLAAPVALIHTGQHYDHGLSDALLAELGLGQPVAHLGVGGDHRGVQIGAACERLTRRFLAQRPAAVVVQGDTNATVAGALAANAAGVPLVHVEAGLRSGDRRMPEEHNRRLADHLADLCCAPTDTNVANLRAEGIAPTRIVRTGNTVVDAVLALRPSPAEVEAVLAAHGVVRGRYLLATLHRPENVDDPAVLQPILAGLRRAPLPVVLPLHPRTRRRIADAGLEHALAGLTVTEPVGYRTFLALLDGCALAVSDSGGVLEEASVIGRPVVVVRRSTERPEVLGTVAHLAGPATLLRAVEALCADLDGVHRQLEALPCPFGDGRAAERTVAAIAGLLDGR